MKHQDPADSPAATSVTLVAAPERSRARSLLLGAGLLLAGGALATALRPPARHVVVAPPAALRPPAVAQAGPLGPQAPGVAQRPVVEVAFVLDTTGSMGGLIAAAKKKIWSIASELADAQPRPEIRIGLVAYRDQGDDYVTRTAPLTADLDAFYAELQQLEAGGGGDTPEAVDEGLRAGLERMSWSGDAQLRLLFLVGDAPPHSARAEACRQVAAQAAQRGIVVNTIQCGEAPETLQAWGELAKAGLGEYLAIDQRARVVAIQTPFDAQVAAAQRQIEATALFYGSPEEQRWSLLQSSSNSSLGTEEYAARSSCLNKTGGFYTQDLLQGVQQGRVDLAALKEEQLPAELRGLSPEARARRLRELEAERAAAQAVLNGLVQQRDAWLRANPTDGDAFDRKLVDCLKAQARSSGLSFSAASGE